MLCPVGSNQLHHWITPSRSKYLPQMRSLLSQWFTPNWTTDRPNERVQGLFCFLQSHCWRGWKWKCCLASTKWNKIVCNLCGAGLLYLQVIRTPPLCHCVLTHRHYSCERLIMMVLAFSLLYYTAAVLLKGKSIRCNSEVITPCWLSSLFSSCICTS